MRILILLTAAAALPFCASASLISVAPDNATTIIFDGGGTCSTGPQTATDADFTISSDGAACFPYSQTALFDDNGIRDNLPMIRDYSGFTTITINPGGSFSSVGGFLNYSRIFVPETFDLFPEGHDPTITALNSNMNVIESVDLFFGINLQYTDVNEGQFYGFSESTENISYFQISGSGIGMSDISLVSPEPATLGLSCLALAALGLFLRRQQKA